MDNLSVVTQCGGIVLFGFDGFVNEISKNKLQDRVVKFLTPPPTPANTPPSTPARVIRNEENKQHTSRRVALPFTRRRNHRRSGSRRSKIRSRTQVPSQTTNHLPLQSTRLTQSFSHLPLAPRITSQSGDVRKNMCKK